MTDPTEDQKQHLREQDPDIWNADEQCDCDRPTCPYCGMEMNGI